MKTRLVLIDISPFSFASYYLRSDSPVSHQKIDKMWYIAGMPVVERNYALVANMFVWTSLALVVIFLRLYTRGVVVKRLGVDDWLMSAALASITLSLCL